VEITASEAEAAAAIRALIAPGDGLGAACVGYGVFGLRLLSGMGQARMWVTFLSAKCRL
jgi:hypothetical protein